MNIEKINKVWLPITYRCNNRCKWCYAPQTLSHAQEKELDPRKEKEFLTFLSALDVKTIILLGGEPTLYSNLFEFISHIREKNIRIGMITNGRRLSNQDYVKELKKAGLSSVTVSIESDDPEIHDNITQISGSLDETIMGIENAIKHDIPTSTETVISHENRNSLFDLVGFLEQFNLRQCAFSTCGPCISDINKSAFSITPNEGAEVFRRLYIHSNKKNLKLTTSTPLCSFDSKFGELVIEKRIASTGCHILLGSNFVLDANGDILPCVHFTNFPILNIYDDGHIMSSQTFLERYNDPEGTNQKFRKALRRYPSIKCKEGNCWDPCLGGCPIFWFKYDPDIEIRGMANI